MSGLGDFDDRLKEIYEPILRKQINKTHGFFKPYTKKQQAQYDQHMAERKAWNESFQRTYDLMSKDNPVLQLHSKSDRGECDGCDFGGMESEPPDWPCRTVNLILTGKADFYFTPPTPLPQAEYVAPTKTVKYTIAPRNLEFGEKD